MTTTTAPVAVHDAFLAAETDAAWRTVWRPACGCGWEHDEALPLDAADEVMVEHVEEGAA